MKGVNLASMTFLHLTVVTMSGADCHDYNKRPTLEELINTTEELGMSNSM